MAKAIDVGASSSRTPFKHWVLDKELGRIVGVMSTGRVHAKACPMLMVDLCAGNAVPTPESPHTSPAIIIKHAKFLLRHNLSVKAILIEKKQKTFELLRQNTPDLMWLERMNMDARQYEMQCTDKHQAVFIHADPNTIADWPITEQLTASLSETTTMLATLGCNVGGLKRLDVGERLNWFDHVKHCIGGMPRYHDAILIELVNDASQWAYLLRLPAVWATETMYQLSTQGRKYSAFDLNMASVRTSIDGFNEMQNRLFLTKKERGVE